MQMLTLTYLFELYTFLLAPQPAEVLYEASISKDHWYDKQYEQTNCKSSQNI